MAATRRVPPRRASWAAAATCGLAALVVMVLVRFPVLPLATPLATVPTTPRAAGSGVGKRGRNRERKRPPHIVMMVADDLGWYDVGFHGNEDAYTPTLDRLAAQGVVMQRHYSGRYCSPSRAMLLTGRYSWKMGLESDLNMYPPEAMRCALQPHFGETIAEKLQRSGKYMTAMFGKWGVGHYTPRVTPLARGFDTFVGGFSLGGRQGKFLKNLCFHKEESLPKECFLVGAVVNGTTSSGSGPRYEPIRPHDNYELADDLFVDELDRVVGQHVKGRDPRSMFLYMAFFSPHGPLDAPQRFNELVYPTPTSCSDKLRRSHLALVASLDENVGRVLHSLARWRVLSDTLIVFLSDNGGQTPNQPDPSTWCGASGMGFNWPLRGSKASWWEGGVRSVSLVYSTNTDLIPVERRGTTYSELFSIVDWHATLSSVAGVAGVVGGLVALDSVDHSSHLFGSAAAARARGDDDDLRPPRTSIVLQSWPSKERFAALVKLNTGQIFKWLRGWPTRGNGGPGYEPASMVNSKHWMYVPPELVTRQTVKNHSAMAPADEPIRPCAPPHGCIFEVVHDPREMDDLVALQRSVPTAVREAFSNLLRDSTASAVELPDSGSCEPGFLPPKEKWSYDEEGKLRVAECLLILPWVDVEANKCT